MILRMQMVCINRRYMQVNATCKSMLDIDQCYV